MKLKGAASRASKSVHYDVRQVAAYSWALCSGRCNVVFVGSNEAYRQRHPVLAWGYLGRGPELLSVGLLSLALLGWNIGRFNHIKIWDLGSWRTKVVRNYRKFARQVVAKLPDIWEMSTEEILAWLNDNNQLPACVPKHQQQNTKRKHGKVKTA